MLRQSVITYDGLPVSSGGAHKLRTKGLVDAWTQTESFLEQCTDYQFPYEIIIELLEGGGLPSDFVLPLKQRFSARFASVRSRRLGPDVVGYQWSVAYDNLPGLVEELESLQPYPEFFLSPLSLNITCKFRFTDPRTGEALPFQDPADYGNHSVGFRWLLGESMAYARLSTNSTLSVLLSLPFEKADSEFASYVQFLGKNAPFKFSEKHWKIWTINKKGTGYVERKIQGLQILQQKAPP